MTGLWEALDTGGGLLLLGVELAVGGWRYGQRMTKRYAEHQRQWQQVHAASQEIGRRMVSLEVAVQEGIAARAEAKSEWVCRLSQRDGCTACPLHETDTPHE